MAIGNLIRLAPLQLDELPAHPILETRFPKSICHGFTKSRIEVTNSRQGLGDDSSASQGVSQAQARQRNSTFEVNDVSNVVLAGHPNPPMDAPGTIKDDSHMEDEIRSPSILDQTGRPNIIPFIRAILGEATSFIDMVVPCRFEDDGLKSSPPSTAKVRLSKKLIKGSELSQVTWESSTIPRTAPQGIQKTSEAWFARTSIHRSQTMEGTANFAELDFALRRDHSKHEREYTPDVFDDFKVLDWDFSAEPNGLAIDQYRHVTMGIYEMCHKLPFPMAPRVFPVLVVTAQTEPGKFVVVQIPVNLESLPDAFYSNGRNLLEGTSTLQRKKPVLGVYTSIERCLMNENEERTSTGDIKWVMATASDAKGRLPMWMQKLGVPGAVVKDVGLVMKWLHDRRVNREPIQIPPKYVSSRTPGV